MTKLYIRNMICTRCKMIVKAELEKLGLQVARVDLGSADIQGYITTDQRDQLNSALKKARLELMEDKKTILVERVKNVIIEMIHHADEFHKVKYSVYISEKLGLSYTYLSNVFSEATGCTIEQFIIANKIERVKELLMYDEYNLTQISYKLDYSSVAHLSNQFKKVTGITPSRFKKMKVNRRLALDEL